MAVHEISTEVIGNKDYARVQRGLADGTETNASGAGRDGTGVQRLLAEELAHPENVVYPDDPPYVPLPTRTGQVVATMIPNRRVEKEDDI